MAERRAGWKRCYRYERRDPIFCHPLPGAAVVRFRLETGRTHQIRVHAADHGWPLVGDPLYGRTPRPLAAIAAQLGRQALHAALLELDHPTTGARLRFEAPLPDDLIAALSQLRGTPPSGNDPF